MRKPVKAAAGLLAVGLLATPFVARAGDTSQPANKAAASGRTRVEIAPQTLRELLRTIVRTSKPEDLILQVSLECSILTSLVTDNDTPLATSLGRVRVWVEIDGRVVPIADTSAPPQNTNFTGDKARDSVVFCDRTYRRTVTDLEGDLRRLIDRESDYIRTKSANAFNWLRLNLGSGLHTIVVKGDLTVGDETRVCPSTESATTTCSQAYVGNRTLIVEPTRTAVNAVIN